MMNTDFSTSIMIVIRNGYLPKLTHIDGGDISDIEIKVTKIMESNRNRIILQKLIVALSKVYKNTKSYYSRGIRQVIISTDDFHETLNFLLSRKYDLLCQCYQQTETEIS